MNVDSDLSPNEKEEEHTFPGRKKLNMTELKKPNCPGNRNALWENSITPSQIFKKPSRLLNQVFYNCPLGS